MASLCKISCAVFAPLHAAACSPCGCVPATHGTPSLLHAADAPRNAPARHVVLAQLDDDPIALVDANAMVADLAAREAVDLLARVLQLHLEVVSCNLQAETSAASVRARLGTFALPTPRAPPCGARSARRDAVVVVGSHEECLFRKSRRGESCAAPCGLRRDAAPPRRGPPLPSPLRRRNRAALRTLVTMPFISIISDLHS